MTLMMYYIGLNIYIYIFSYVSLKHTYVAQKQLTMYYYIMMWSFVHIIQMFWLLGDDNIISSSDETDSSSDDNLLFD